MPIGFVRLHARVFCVWNWGASFPSSMPAIVFHFKPFGLTVLHFVPDYTPWIFVHWEPAWKLYFIFICVSLYFMNNFMFTCGSDAFTERFFSAFGLYNYSNCFLPSVFYFLFLLGSATYVWFLEDGVALLFYGMISSYSVRISAPLSHAKLPWLVNCANN
jgi:hypothetical protein